MPSNIDEAVYDIVRNRATWSKKTHLRVGEIADLCFVRFGVQLPGDQIRESIRRLVRRRMIRWAKIRDNDIYVLP